jgi:diaminopimelate epimerase
MQKVSRIQFHKMHGAGNDYVYINTIKYPVSAPEALSIEWSKPHTGIGADGIVLIGKSDMADFSMHIFNADGSEAMMCGNASRCIGKYVYDLGLTTKTTVTLETLSGIKTLLLDVRDGKVAYVTVDMGTPVFNKSTEKVSVGDSLYKGYVVSMGNPHFVVFVDDVESVNLSETGPGIENHSLFPDRTNVEFAQIVNNEKIRMRVWERGSGITQACGTGACATLVASVIAGKCSRKAEIVMDGGSLFIEWDDNKDKVMMKGNAVMVFEGIINLE